MNFREDRDGVIFVSFVQSVL